MTFTDNRQDMFNTFLRPVMNVIKEGNLKTFLTEATKIGHF